MAEKYMCTQGGSRCHLLDLGLSSISGSVFYCTNILALLFPFPGRLCSEWWILHPLWCVILTTEGVHYL